MTGQDIARSPGQSFYESDCQARTPSWLIAAAFWRGQSASELDWAVRRSSAPGSVGSSFSSASFSSPNAPEVRWTAASTWDARGEPGFYPRLGRGRPACGLFGSCGRAYGQLSVSATAGRTTELRLAPAPASGTAGGHERGRESPRVAPPSGISALVRSASWSRSALPFSRGGG